MAKGQHFSKHQQNIVKNYYENLDTLMLQKLGEIVSDLYLSSDDSVKTARLWDSARKSLEKLKAEPGRVSSITTKRNIEELALFVGDLTLADNVASAQQPSQQPDASPPPAPAPGSPPETTTPPDTSVPSDSDQTMDRQTLKRAMKAFRKRLKLTRLDQESSLGYGPITGGRKSDVVAIQPPNQYPKEVWAELVKQGRLKDAGQGFYELIDQ